MSTENPVGNRPNPLGTTMSRPKDQPLASEKLAENVKADVTTKGLQAIPSGSTQTNGATVP